MRFVLVAMAVLVLGTQSAEARTSGDIINTFNQNPAAMLIDGKPVMRAERGPFGSICGYDAQEQLISCRNKKEMNKLIDAWVKGGSKKPVLANDEKSQNKTKAAVKAKPKRARKAEMGKAPTKVNALAAMKKIKSFKPSYLAAYTNAANGQPELWITHRDLSAFPSFETKAKFTLSCKDDWDDDMFAPMTLKGQVINGAIFVTDNQTGNGPALEKIGRGVYESCMVSNAKWKISWVE